MSDRKYAYYDDVCVDAEARRMGVGKALMQYAEDYAKSADATISNSMYGS